MTRVILGLIAILAISCSTSIGEEKESRITDLTGSESVVTSWTKDYNSNSGTTKTLTINIYEPKKIDVENKRKLDSVNILVASVIFNDLAEIDTTNNVIQIIYNSEDKRKIRGYDIDELLALLGIHYFENGNHEKGIAFMTKAINLSPNESKHYNNRANFYYELKEFDKALTDITKANDLEPNDPLQLRSVAAVYLELRDFDKAREIIERVIRIDSKYSAAYALRARIFKRTDKLDSAILDFKKAISLETTFNKWKKELSEAYFEHKDLNNALETIDNYLIRESKDGDGYLLKGKILLQMKRKEQACETFKEAASLGASDASNYITKECKAV